MEEVKWLTWAKQIQAISQIGLAYGKDIYDIERYEQLRSLSVEIVNTYTKVDSDQITDLFANETGYATPKVDVRGVIFQDDKILLVKEKADGAWALPGGWADIGLSPREIVVKEVKEESGFDVVPRRLLAVLDKNKHYHAPSPYHVYKIFILCEIMGGSAMEGMETSEVKFFDRSNLPQLSEERNTYGQVQLMFDKGLQANSEVIFD
ncbi:ADP-ribose pyrophosphatase [Paenibacillus sp. J45TS6]|uniref:NUDIX hydrolase n=1 Tax=unclassified Paenibacillus TaxID=185978 RepID=UPI001B079521|nr:NUDIX hydrolase [Paenibacillus sp. J45TS6]GIP42994.1 ADP-ribose pyrophosphatase [Paenibacillus sp. J45TS6]